MLSTRFRDLSMHARTNSESATATARARSSSRLHDLFYGPLELRAGWRLLVFVVVVMVLIFAKTALLRRLPHSSHQAVRYLIDKTLKFTVLLSASCIMAKIEARTIAEYGLPWRTMFGRRFWKGRAWASTGNNAQKNCGLPHALHHHARSFALQEISCLCLEECVG